MSESPMVCWSYGGGVQSAGIAVLIREGALPTPDLAVIADTGRERQATWDYLRDVIQPYLAPTGLVIERAAFEPERAKLYDPQGLTLMPAYTASGRLVGYCSSQWKRDVVERFLRARGVRRCTQWLGFSLDEVSRCGKPHRDWCQLAYPLIDLAITRRGCIALVEKAGLPPAPKSRCWMCPQQNDAEWQEVRDNPNEWAAAQALEKEISENDPTGAGLFLHKQRVPLEQVKFKTEAETMPLLRHCEDAGCWT